MSFGVLKTVQHGDKGGKTHTNSDMKKNTNKPVNCLFSIKK